MRPRLKKLARRHPSLRPWLERLEEKKDWSGAKNFFLALLLLGVALVLALNGAVALERGNKQLMALFHTLALALTFFVGVKLVPRMARGTPLRWLFYQVDYKLTKEGGVYLLGVFILILAALNTGNNLLFIILSSLLAGILVSGVVSRMVLTGIGLKLELPDHVFARQPMLASLTLENQKRTLPSFSLTVSGGAAATGKARASPAKPAASVAGTGSDRRVLREPVYFPYIPHHRPATQPVELTFPRRGRYAQDVFRVCSKFPFGFLLKTRQLRAGSEVVVYPPVEPTEEFYEILPLISGEMESYFKGRGHDLYSIRDHQPSDSARYVDWKATAKAQRLQVREFTREDERRVELVFDPVLPPEAPGKVPVEERRSAAPLDPARDALGASGEEWFERGVNFCACLAWHFYEIDAQLKFRSPAWETGVARASDIIYDVLYHLALIEPRRASDDDFLEWLGRETNTFKIVLTARERGSIPTGLWSCSYFVFMQSL
ncbi:MAG: DUF58 domain-containing protein [Terriglobia bacterium]